MRVLGLRPIEVWARPEDHATIKEFVWVLLEKQPPNESA
jgi:hypothetical protein